MSAWIFAASMLGIGIWYLITYGDKLPEDERKGYANAVVKADVIASIFWEL